MHALLERHRQQQDHEDYRAALAATVVTNIFRKEGTPPVHPLDWYRPRTESESSWEQHLAVVEALNEAFGGRDLRV